MQEASAEFQEDQSWDVFLSHRSTDKPWVEVLARNLESAGYRVFLDVWALAPGDGLVPALWKALKRSRKAVLVATEAAIQSGWVRAEYETLFDRRQKEPDFRLVPIVFGPVPDLPFLPNIVCVDFRLADEASYRRAFHQLVSGLEGLPPGSGTHTAAIELPDFGAKPDSSRKELTSGSAAFVETVFNSLLHHPFQLLLAQAYQTDAAIVDAIGNRASAAWSRIQIRPRYGEDPQQFFAHLGARCGLGTGVTNSDALYEGLAERIKKGEKIFLMVSGFENCNEQRGRELGRTLRALWEDHGKGFRVLLVGGERLAALFYESGQDSLLNLAEAIAWPELGAIDVIELAQRDFALAITADQATEILGRCGAHPRLVRYNLEFLQRGEIMGAPQLAEHSVLWQAFTPFQGDGAARAQVCAWLAQPEVANFGPWPADALVRKLFWANVLVRRGGRFVWGSAAVREAGRRALECE
jgi:hypothetical protein